MRFYHHLIAIFIVMTSFLPNSYALDYVNLYDAFNSNGSIAQEARKEQEKAVENELYKGSAHVQSIVTETPIGRAKTYSIIIKISFEDFPNLYKFNSLWFTELDTGLSNGVYKPENGSSILIPSYKVDAIFSAKSDKISLTKIEPTQSYGVTLATVTPKYVHYDIESYESAKIELAQKQAAERKAEDERNSLTGRIKGLFGK
ncbi:MAG: hypothetical protein AB7S56_05235 [Halothiobacillaceae bacterium]